MDDVGDEKALGDSEGHRAGEDNDDEDHHEHFYHDCSRLSDFFKTLQSKPWLWKYLLQTTMIFTGFWITWKLATPPATNLHAETLTPDGKSFPSGQLTWAQKFTPLPCGTTPAEALARGCHFDIIATAWLPSKCIDYELAAEFAALHPWQYFANRNGTDPFPDDPDVLGTQTGLVWTTDRWHAAHCLYMWKKLNRAIVGGWMTDAETVSQSHTDHCTMNIMNMKEPDAIKGVMEVIYPPC
jgi:hypothetical protein